MPQSLAKLYVHLIWSTKDRQPSIDDDIREQLHAYITGIFKRLECDLVRINSVPDHVHTLFRLSRKHAVATIVEEVKKSSSKWMKQQDERFAGFYWQSGYGAFSVSHSLVNRVVAYIVNQEEHHKRVSFQEEYRTFLKKHNVEFDERYVWD